MKKILSTFLAIVAAALAAGAIYSMASAPPEPAPGWRMHMTDQQHALLIAPIDHAFRAGAYLITWAIQLGYLAWIAFKWNSEQRTSR